MADESAEIPSLDLHHLRFLGPLGRGAKGVVFRVRVSGSDDDFALKVVLKASIRAKNGSKSNSGSSRDRDKTGLGLGLGRVGFEREVLRCLHHPLLPTLRGVLETQNVIGYAIDYCPGQDLHCLRQLQSEKMFSQEFIRFYGAELVLALEHLHKLGIVYRDLKPGNILIQENGHLMLVDFDLSTKLAPRSPITRLSTPDPSQNSEPPKKTCLPTVLRCFNSEVPESMSESDSVDPAESDSAGEKSNSFVGTEDYVAPEMVAGNGHDYGVDWWSLGVVMYEMLYGTTPFRGANRKDTFYKIVSKAPDLAGETTPLRDLIGRLLEKDPMKRIQLEEIKGHDFFGGVDWEMIWQIQRPPFIPIETEVEKGDMEGIMGFDVESIVRGIFQGENEKINENKRVWVEGLVHPSESDNFSVF